jgi:hypothetical protein
MGCCGNGREPMGSSYSGFGVIFAAIPGPLASNSEVDMKRLIGALSLLLFKLTGPHEGCNGYCDDPWGHVRSLRTRGRLAHDTRAAWPSPGGEIPRGR